MQITIFNSCPLSCVMVRFTDHKALQDLFKTMNDEVRKAIDTVLSRKSRSSRFDISQVCFSKEVF